MNKNPLSNKKLFSIGIVALVLSFLGTWIGSDIYFKKLYKIDQLNKKSESLDEQKQFEIALIYIGCSTCGFANVKELPLAFEKVKQVLKKQAVSYGYGFKIIGISRDHIITEGLAHLAKYGAFDEVMTGNSWSNTGLIKYMYNQIPGEASTPQILVTRRSFLNINNQERAVYRGLKNENLLVRKIGVQEIIKWADAGAPLPTDSFDFNYV